MPKTRPSGKVMGTCHPREVAPRRVRSGPPVGLRRLGAERGRGVGRRRERPGRPVRRSGFSGLEPADKFPDGEGLPGSQAAREETAESKDRLPTSSKAACFLPDQ